MKYAVILTLFVLSFFGPAFAQVAKVENTGQISEEAIQLQKASWQRLSATAWLKEINKDTEDEIVATVELLEYVVLTISEDDTELEVSEAHIGVLLGIGTPCVDSTEHQVILWLHNQPTGILYTCNTLEQDVEIPTGFQDVIGPFPSELASYQNK